MVQRKNGCQLYCTMFFRDKEQRMISLEITPPSKKNQQQGHTLITSKINKIISFIISMKYLNNINEEDTLKTMECWWKKLKRTEINGKVSHFPGLKGLILLKCPYLTNQSNLQVQFNPSQNSKDFIFMEI